MCGQTLNRLKYSSFSLQYLRVYVLTRMYLVYVDLFSVPLCVWEKLGVIFVVRVLIFGLIFKSTEKRGTKSYV